MPNPVSPERRQLLRHAAGVSAAPVLLGLTACQGGHPADRALAWHTLSQAEVELERLAAAVARDSSATWSWAQTLVHAAQSIEYSMTGFPQPRSALFQATLGAAAFAVFRWRGRMTHDRTEPIPGAPALVADLDAAQALARLKSAMSAFQRWQGPLKPHFAYGALDHADYTRAHAMHLADHLSQFDARA